MLRSLFKSLAGPAAEAASSASSGAVQTLIKGGSSSMAAASQPIVLVTGATGGVGKRVVAQLLQRGRRVRALVRDAQKGSSLLAGLPAAAGASLELVAADVTQPRTLLPEMFEGVGQVVCCTAVKVAPKEGDTAGRDKYYQVCAVGGWGCNRDAQARPSGCSFCSLLLIVLSVSAFQGIKFFDPEIVGDTPEAVEWRGMQNLLAAVGSHLGSAASRLVFAPDGSGGESIAIGARVGRVGVVWAARWHPLCACHASTFCTGL